MTIILDGSTGIVSDSTASNPAMTAKGNGSDVEGYIQLNCRVNSHGVKLKSPPHSSGQSYTMVLPDNQVAADKFLKVKSITGSGANAVGQLEYADVAGGGITHARIYRINTTFILTSGSATLSANWEYEDNASAGNLGSGWSLPSSGVFSFPATGIYTVKFHSMWNAPIETNTPYGGISLQGTTDNFSSIDYRSDAYSSQSDDFPQVRYHNVHLGAMFDVTDTSNVKFKLLVFRDVNYGNISFLGSSTSNYTYVEVIRLGDT